MFRNFCFLLIFLEILIFFVPSEGGQKMPVVKLVIETDLTVILSKTSIIYKIKKKRTNF